MKGDVSLLWTLSLLWIMLLCTCTPSKGRQQSQIEKRFSIKRIPSWMRSPSPFLFVYPKIFKSLMPDNKKLANGRKPSTENIEDYLDSVGDDTGYNIEEDGEVLEKAKGGGWEDLNQMSQNEELVKRSQKFKNFPSVQLGKRNSKNFPSVELEKRSSKNFLAVQLGRQSGKNFPRVQLDRKKRSLDVLDKPEKKKFPDMNWGKRSMDDANLIEKKKFPDINWGKRHRNLKSYPVNSVFGEEVRIDKKYSKGFESSKVLDKMKQRQNEGLRQYSLMTNRIPSYKEKCLLAALRKIPKDDFDIQNTNERGKNRKNRKIFVRIG